MMTSCGNRNPAKLDLGADTRAGRGRITSACPDLALHRCNRPRWGSGAPWPRYSPRPEPSAAGFHKIANVLGAMPKSAHPGAKKALTAIWGAENKAQAAAGGGAGVRGDLRREVPQGHGEDHRRARRAVGPL